MFTDQIHAIVQDNISNEKFGVSELAAALGLSNSQTLRKVKAATGKSVNQYIRELRLEEAAKLIKTTDHSIAEISFKVGFGSPSYFNKAFSKYFKVAPGEYKTQPNTTHLETEKTEDIISTESKPNNNKKLMRFAAAAVLIVVIGYVLINHLNSKDNSLTNSIAVLPFKDLSPEDNQWFCDGVSDNILHALAQMNDLTVTSFTSSSTFRDSDKQIPEIAKELGVSYILEGSVVLFEGKIKIITQLIDANDQHVWSKEYNENFEDIISVQNNVAQEVMRQLKFTLSPKEEKVLEKYPTKNMEAYSLHLKGRSEDGDIQVRDLELNIKMNKKAIALDSSFSQAYAEVAKSYYQLSYYRPDSVNVFESRNKSSYYLNKTLELDSSNAIAWTIKSLLSFHIDWNQAEVYLDKAISLNPNEPFALNTRGTYYTYGPNRDFKKALADYRRAFKLNPLSSMVAIRFYTSLLSNGHVKEAAELLENIKFLYYEELVYLLNRGLIGAKNKSYTTLLAESKSRIEAHPDKALYYLMLADEYEGIWKDDEKSLENIKKAYDLDSKYMIGYINLLIKTERYEEASVLMKSDQFKSNFEKKIRLNILWWYYYRQKKYTKALDVLKDSLYANEYSKHAYTFAQMGNRKKVDSMNKRYPWGRGVLYWHKNKAIIHAALKDRDSMYFYLERVYGPQRIQNISCRIEFDPYRHEDRFKAFLRKNYLPVPGE
jgi:TolB-like protein/AraC-like DNA-binding protein/predicted Zn-dependent protease